jgi:hypothetical protein
LVYIFPGLVCCTKKNPANLIEPQSGASKKLFFHRKRFVRNRNVFEKILFLGSSPFFLVDCLQLSDRVAGLGEFSPIVRLFTLGCFQKVAKLCAKYWATSCPREELCIGLGQKTSWGTLLALLSQTHPVTQLRKIVPRRELFRPTETILGTAAPFSPSGFKAVESRVARFFLVQNTKMGENVPY